MTTEPPRYDASMIEILTAREVVRRRPAMYIGPLDSDASHRLIWCAVDGLIWHYRQLGHALEQIDVALQADGSAVVVGYGQQPLAAHGQRGMQQLLRKLQVFDVASSVGLFLLNALSARLTVEVCDADDLWHSFTFEQGVLLREESPSHLAERGGEIRLTFWPDFTILEAVPFDRARTLEGLRPFADSDPAVPIDVIDAPPDTE